MNDFRLAVRERPPERHPVMRQEWEHLLFLHWEIDPEEIAKRLPPGLRPDLFEGKAYVGVVPFYMSRVRPVFCPPLPGLSWFLELNVRTYVIDEEGRSGVWFFSLDCDQWLAVKIARNLFHLPYEHARMKSHIETEGIIDYQSERIGEKIPAHYKYNGSGAVQEADLGSLEFFLLERYLLFSKNKNGTLKRGRVHHKPYQYQKAQVHQTSPQPLLWNSFELSGNAVSALYCQRVEVEIFALQ